MKKIIFVIMVFAAIGFLFSCGPNKAELAEKVRQDSIRVADSLKRVEEIATQKAKTDSIERDKRVIAMIEEFYKKYVFGDQFNVEDAEKEAILNKYCTKNLINRDLIEADMDFDGDDVCDPFFYLNAFVNGSQDYGGEDDRVTNVKVLGNGKYYVSYINYGEGSLIISVVDDGGSIKFDGIDNLSVNPVDNSIEQDTNITENSEGTRSYLHCPDDNHPHKIDLGLPSGTLWACCNVGAIEPEGNGGHYMWGETEEQEECSKRSYKYYDNHLGYIDLGKSICGTKYDVAHVKWGDTWQMPSANQYLELLNYCKYQSTNLNGIRGGMLIGQNGGSVFFPFAGIRGGGLYSVGQHGFYLSGTQANGYISCTFSVHLNSGGIGWEEDRRDDGYSVRPVAK